MLDNKELQKFKKTVEYNKEIHGGYYETPLPCNFLEELITTLEATQAELAEIRLKLDFVVELEADITDFRKQLAEAQAEVERLQGKGYFGIGHKPDIFVDTGGHVE